MYISYIFSFIVKGFAKLALSFSCYLMTIFHVVIFLTAVTSAVSGLKVKVSAIEQGNLTTCDQICKSLFVDHSMPCSLI
jgi:hypothetical protein